MVVQADDRISDVLKKNEALIDVFVTLSPAFERLRNPGMRRVMSRLVTVRQAARLGGVALDALLAQLNASIDSGAAPTQSAAEAPDPAADTPLPAADTPLPTADAPLPAAAAPETAANSSAKHASNGRPAALSAIAADDIVTCDVRDELRAGREPFSIIMAALRSVPIGGALCVRATFEPVPLYAVMRRQELAHYTESVADDDWIVWFYPETAPVTDSKPAVDAPAAREAGGDDAVVILDVRGLEPPEPMMRTLAALEELPEGATLVQLNVRVPRFLLPLLDERGFTYEIREQGDDLVRLFIRRGDNPAI